MPKVKFTSEGKEIEVEPGANLRRVALKNGIPLYPGIHRILNCRGLAQCGSCMVLLKNGSGAHASKKGLLETLRLSLGWAAIGHEGEARLACQTRVLGDLEVVTRPEFNWFGLTGRK
jgi:ferredoxin